MRNIYILKLRPVGTRYMLKLRNTISGAMYILEGEDLIGWILKIEAVLNLLRIDNTLDSFVDQRSLGIPCARLAFNSCERIFHLLELRFLVDWWVDILYISEDTQAYTII